MAIQDVEDVVDGIVLSEDRREELLKAILEELIQIKEILMLQGNISSSEVRKEMQARMSTNYRDAE